MMRRVSLKFTGFVLCIVLLSAACGKKNDADGYEQLLFSDDTTQAADLVASANEDLNKIKVLYKKNSARTDDLTAALTAKDIEKVKTISNDLVYILNDGIKLGEEAVEKIEKAESLNINPDFKQYLNDKSDSLRKQLEAFEYRRKAAIILRDSAAANDAAQVEKIKLGFKENEDTFQKIMKDAQDESKKANDFARDVAKREKSG